MTLLSKGSTLLLSNLRIIWEFAHPASHHNTGIETGGDVLFWSDMTNTSTYVRLLRHLGIALIFAPEPFTTPFGVACILAARHLSKRNEASVSNRLREMVQYYLAHTGRFFDHVDGEAGAPAPAKRHNLSKERAVLGQITGSRSFEASCSIRQRKCDIRDATVRHTKDMQSLSRRHEAANVFADTSTRTENAIHHTINTEWLSRRYEGWDNAMAHSGWVTTSGAPEGIMRHSGNTPLLSQRHKTGTVGYTKTKSYTMKTVQLRQRYGSAVNYTTALNALQNNNHYYDMLSRKNVIGGY